jgi:hypothetical protein
MCRSILIDVFNKIQPEIFGSMHSPLKMDWFDIPNVSEWICANQKN